MVKVQDKIIKRKNKVFKTIEGKTYILDEKTDNFYTLNETASFIWKKIAKPVSFNKLVDIMVGHFTVSTTKAKKDLKDLISYFKKRDLVTVKKSETK